MSNLSREQAILEYAKCAKNTAYALKTYLQTYDNTQSQYVPLDLFPDQISLIEDYDKYEENDDLFYKEAMGKLAYFVSLWYMGRANSKEDFDVAGPFKSQILSFIEPSCTKKLFNSNCPLS